MDLFLNVSGHVILLTLKWTPESDIMLKTPATMKTLALVRLKQESQLEISQRFGTESRAVFLWAVADINNESGVWRTAIELKG